MIQTSIKRRSQLYQTIRKFFNDRSYLEVETPILSETLIPESTIENFSTTFTSDFHPNGERFLIPSPEIHMKKLIAEGSGSIFQIAKCFRNSEQIGNHHNPEFSMLEWYTMEADYQDSIQLTEELLKAAAQPETAEHITPPFKKMSIAEAFSIYAGFDIEKAQSLAAITAKAKALGLTPPKGPTTWEDEFNRIFLTFVEPNLPQEKPLILLDYPVQIRCLAKEKLGTPYRERWELYAGGLELANCYTEETQAVKVREHYRTEFGKLVQERRKSGSVIPETDDSFAEIFTETYPECSGTAMGLDRLLMVLYNIKTIRGVMLFPFSDTIC
ncbi:MAG: elongation factor P--(R)-beta-lysine ligase [Spirochaetales bacterium]|jgi:lysyl-tRNA synthetase class 2|nr:elongation factor P--(R)-beta-lysine ligase [Spirochaetales bacterium]